MTTLLNKIMPDPILKAKEDAMKKEAEARKPAVTHSETDNGLNRPNEVDDMLFKLLSDSDGMLCVSKFWNIIKSTGIRPKDFRLKECYKKFAEKQKEVIQEAGGGAFAVDLATFKECVADNIVVISKIFKNEMVIPEFQEFNGQIRRIFDSCKANTKGKPADYIPQLARVPPHHWGVSICTIDGQRYSTGDTNLPFCLQSTCKPLNYALAVSDLGPDKVHKYIGQEPSGRSFNELTLDHNNKPHNPMINAGAIVTTSLLKPGTQVADRFDYAVNHYKRLAGGEFVGFSNATEEDLAKESNSMHACVLKSPIYLSERETADRNFALGYYMRENQCFIEGTDLTQTLEFYFQLCSVEVTAESASVIAATLANGGICPTTGERVLAGDAVRNTLSLMHSCGMYDYSGQFAFKVGLPAKSGVAGAILLVVPNVMGICTWSPSLDECGNSCRGVQFCEELVSTFNFHNYDNLCHSAKKLDPRKSRIDIEATSVVNLLFGAANGDVTAIRRFAMMGIDMSNADYDGRTALHLACAEGHLTVVKVLVEQCGVPISPRDRWNCTPIEDATKFCHGEIIEYLDSIERDIKSGKKKIKPISFGRSNSVVGKLL